MTPNAFTEEAEITSLSFETVLYMKCAENNKVLRTGTFLYNGFRVCKVRIVRTDLRPGSGDAEDPEEWREDKHGVFFRVDYAPPRSERFSAGGGYFSAIDEAIQAVENSVSGIEWDN